MDRKKLEELYRKKLGDLEVEKSKLGDMFADRIAVNMPLTDEDILEQNKNCSEISLEIARLKEMLDKAEDM